MEEGHFLTLRNAKIDMYKGSMRLAVNQWGVIERAPEQPDFSVKVQLAHPAFLDKLWQWMHSSSFLGSQSHSIFALLYAHFLLVHASMAAARIDDNVKESYLV